MTAFNPLVSIIIPVYNGANYLGQAIESALAQTYPHVEVIVVNDGSRDEGSTAAVALGYGDRIRYFSKENGGVATALNLGIEKMRGTYFSWLSHDDLYHPRKIEAQVQFLAGLPDKTVVLYADQDYVDDQGTLTGEHRCPPVTPERFKVEFIRGWLLHFCTALVPSACFAEVGLFDQALRTSQDVEMIYRLASRYAFYHLPEKLVQVRLHEMMGQVTVKQTVLAENDALRLRFLKEVPPAEIRRHTGEPLAAYYLSFAERMQQAGYPRSGRYAARRALWHTLVEQPAGSKRILFRALRVLYPGLLQKYTTTKNKLKSRVAY